MRTGTWRRAATELLVSVSVLTVLPGCEARRVLFNTGELDKGLVIVLPGIDGRARHNEAVCRVLRKHGVGMAVELYDWTTPLGALFNQCAQSTNRGAARRLAERIVAYLRRYPGRPVFLIGHSGGTAIAAWAAEAIPRGRRIAGIIMLAPSLSPGYDLSAALAHTDRGIVSFHSHLDAALLGAGTTLVGTMDGLHVEAAGKVAFRKPAQAEPARDYRKLVQVAWESGMAESGHDGGHFGPTTPRFVARYVLRFIETSPWDQRLAARVTARVGREIALAPAVAGRR